MSFHGVCSLQFTPGPTFGLKMELLPTLAAPRLLFLSVQWLSHVGLFVTPWNGAHQTSLSITYSRSLLKLMSIESVMPSNHLILCHPPSPAFNLSQCRGLLQGVISLHQVA